MSEPLFRTIVSYFNHATGVDHDGPPPPEREVVHLPAKYTTWRFTEFDPPVENVYHFAIAQYGATGPFDGKVFAFRGGPGDVYWYITPAPDAPAGYSIIAWDHDHTQVWTAEGTEIYLKTIEPGNKNQWFKVLDA